MHHGGSVPIRRNPNPLPLNPNPNFGESGFRRIGKTPSWRTYDGGGTYSFNLLDEELSKFVGVDVS